MCEAGWTGEHCDINKDECQGQPCSNGGECIDETDGFRCQCNEGFTGETCGGFNSTVTVKFTVGLALTSVYDNLHIYAVISILFISRQLINL